MKIKMKVGDKVRVKWGDWVIGTVKELTMCGAYVEVGVGKPFTIWRLNKNIKG